MATAGADTILESELLFPMNERCNGLPIQYLSNGQKVTINNLTSKDWFNRLRYIFNQKANINYDDVIDIMIQCYNLPDDFQIDPLTRFTLRKELAKVKNQCGKCHKLCKNPHRPILIFYVGIDTDEDDNFLGTSIITSMVWYECKKIYTARKQKAAQIQSETAAPV